MIELLSMIDPSLIHNLAQNNVNQPPKTNTEQCATDLVEPEITQMIRLFDVQSTTILLAQRMFERPRDGNHDVEVPCAECTC